MQYALLRIPAVAAILSSANLGFEDPDAVLQKFLQRVRADLDQLTNIVCAQDVERFRRGAPDQPWRKSDTLRLEVGATGDEELYARSGERRFQSKPLADLIGRGTIATGQFANLARQVFGGQPASFKFKGNVEQDGVPALEFTFDVAADNSGYKLRAGTMESIVAFQGVFWIAASSLDLLRLELQAYDIPDELGIAQADTAVSYKRVEIDGAGVLLPRLATLTITATDGAADLNRTRLGSCRQYRTESRLRFDTPEPDGGQPFPGRMATQSTASAELPDRTVLELALESALNPSAARVGDAISARLLNPIRIGSTALAPQGVRVTGVVVRLEQQTQPFPMYEIGLEFNSLEAGSRSIPLMMTMIDAGPANGLIRQSRRLEPTFTRRRGARMDVLVREIQQGQGFLNWDARRGAVPAGLKMKWLVRSGKD